jgi:hypothetical protein
MISNTITVSLTYTPYGSAEIGQGTATLSLPGPELELTAASGTQIVLVHPHGQRLRLSPESARAESTAQALLVFLPARELRFDLRVVAEPSGAAGRIVVTTKKEVSKPDEPELTSFSS